jgi:predicted RNA-binding protein with EMAP domain
MEMEPLALMYKALTRIIMTSGVIAFQGIQKTEIMRGLARISEGLQQYELSHHPMKNLLYKALALSEQINL